MPIRTRSPGSRTMNLLIWNEVQRRKDQRGEEKREERGERGERGERRREERGERREERRLVNQHCWWAEVHI